MKNNLITNYKRDGYIELKNVFTKEDAHNFAVSIIHLINAQKCKGFSIPKNVERKSLSFLKSKINEGLVLLENKDHIFIKKVYDSIRNAPIIDNLTLKPKLIKTIKTLMNLNNTSPLYVTQKACRIDIPNNETFSLDWHQEAPYTIKETELVQLWAPILDDVKKINGALKVLHKSHSAGVVETDDRIPSVGHAQYVPKQKYISKFSEITVEMDYGNVLLFPKTLIHKSGENISDSPRLTLIAHYHNPLAKNFFKNFSNDVEPQAKNSYKNAS